MSGEVRLHSTLTKRKEELVPDPDGTVRIYVCGPTVYGRIHIGNARPFVVFSVLKRYLERRGMRVRLVSNLTDVNDKIYDAARAEGVPSAELARRYSDAYIADTDRLGLGRPDAEPRVTDSIPEIIELIADAGGARARVPLRRRRLLPGGALRGLRAPLGPAPGRDGLGRAGRRQGVAPRLRPLEGAQARRGHLVGVALGARAARGGTSSARRWRRRPSAATSRSTAAASTWSSPTTRTRSPSRRAPTAAGWPRSGCTTRCSSWATRR